MLKAGCAALSRLRAGYGLAAKPEGVDEEVEVGFAGRKGNPLDYCTGDEVGAACFSDGAAGSHGAWNYKVAKLELRQKMAFPSWNLGTRV
jgi:hypothetical protein